MAYAFNEDRSKVDVYTVDQIDAMDFANDQDLQDEIANRIAAVTGEKNARELADSNEAAARALADSDEVAARTGADATINARIDQLVTAGTGGIEVRELLWQQAGGVNSGTIDLPVDFDVANYDCLECECGVAYPSWKIVGYQRIPVTGGTLHSAESDGSNDAMFTALALSVSGTVVTCGNAGNASSGDGGSTWGVASASVMVSKIYGIKYAQDCSVEVADVRVGYDGTTYASAGDAVRCSQMFIDQLNNINLHFPGVKRLGSLNDSGTFSPNYTYRVATSDIVSFSFDVKVNVDVGFRFAIHYYDDQDNHIDGSGWKTHSDTRSALIIPAGARFKWLIAKVDEQTSDIANISEFMSHVQIERVLEKELSISYGIENLKHALNWEIGSLTSVGKDYQTTWRIRSSIAMFPFDVFVSIGKGFNCRIVTFANASMSTPVESQWLYGNLAQELYIPANTWFRYQCCKDQQDNNTYIIGDIKTSEIFHAVVIGRIADRLYDYKATNDTFLSVAHQGYGLRSETTNSCKLEGYRRAKEHGFNGAECDIKFSSDGVPVCSHDSTFTNTNDGSTVITIANETVAALKTYGFHNGTIATLDEVVCACKKFGLTLFLDQLTSSWSNSQWQAVFDVVSKYQMQKHVVWFAGNNAIQQKVFAFDPYATILILATKSNISDVITRALNVAGDNNQVLIGLDYTGITVENVILWNESITPSNVEIGLYTIDSSIVYGEFLPYVSFIVSNKLCYRDVIGLL